MAKSKMMVFTVRGRGYFPYDMLRYDACYPYSQSDVATMTGNTHFPSTEQRKTFLKEERDVRLATNLGKITPERWRSFGWFVIPTSISNY